MRVALDSRTLQDGNRSGIGRQLRHLLPLLASEVELALLTDARRPPLGLGMPEYPLAAPGSARGAAWLQLAAPRWLSGFTGLFHCPFYGLPYRQSVPMVVTIHDLTFEDHPRWFRMSQRAAFRAQARHAARSARRILTVSEHARHRIIDRYQVGEERVLVTPPGVDQRFRPDPDRGALHRLLESLRVKTPYLVALGGARRRALWMAVEAWRHLGAQGAKVALVVVGPERPPGEPGLVHAGTLDDAAWALLLAGAEAFCYPTGYEGFGMPALEAAASGTPVVCAPVGALPEVMGSAAAWCEPRTPEAIASRLRRLLQDSEDAKELQDKGLKVAAARGGWAKMADVTLKAYRESFEG